MQFDMVSCTFFYFFCSFLLRKYEHARDDQQSVKKFVTGNTLSYIHFFGNSFFIQFIVSIKLLRFCAKKNIKYNGNIALL